MLALWWGCQAVQAIVEKLMEVSPNSLVLCISARSEMVMSKRHPHTPVPLLKVLHTVREECWHFMQSVVRAIVSTGHKHVAPFVSRNVQTVGFLGFGQCFPGRLLRKGEGSSSRLSSFPLSPNPRF